MTAVSSPSARAPWRHPDGPCFRSLIKRELFRTDEEFRVALKRLADRGMTPAAETLRRFEVWLAS